MQGCQRCTCLPKGPEIGGKGDTRQILAQICPIPRPVDRGVQQTIEVVPDVVLRNVESWILTAELLQAPVCDVVDTPVAGHGFQARFVGLRPSIRTVRVVGLVAPAGKLWGTCYEVQVRNNIPYQRRETCRCSPPRDADDLVRGLRRRKHGGI